MLACLFTLKTDSFSFFLSFVATPVYSALIRGLLYIEIRTDDHDPVVVPGEIVGCIRAFSNGTDLICVKHLNCYRLIGCQIAPSLPCHLREKKKEKDLAPEKEHKGHFA